MALSEGVIWAIGFFCHTHSFLPISSPRSTFPTSNFFPCLQVRIVGGLFLSRQRYDSLFSHLLEINYCRKPPWILNYLNQSPVSLFFSPVPDSYRQKSVPDSYRQKSVPDLTLGFIDTPIDLPPAIESCAVSINRHNLVVTMVNSRTQHFSALIGPRIWGWGLADDCVGRILSPWMFQFKFRFEGSMNWVLHRDPRSLHGWMLPIHQWYLTIIEETRKINLFFFRISGTLTLSFTNAMASFVGSKIGMVTAVDFWLYQFGCCCELSNLQVGLVNFCRQGFVDIAQIERLEKILVTLRWVIIDMRGSDIWDAMVNFFVVMLKRITQALYFKETLVRKCWCHYVSISELALDTSAFMLRFVKRSHSQRLLYTIRHKEESNMKLDNNRSLDRLASKATLRKASSNSLLLYFLLVYGTYICVCNNCISLILYVSVITLFD